MRLKFTSFFIASIVAFSFSCTTTKKESIHPKEKVDLILYNAKVYSFSWDNPDENGIPSSNAPYNDGIWTPDASVIIIKNGLIQEIGESSLLVNYEAHDSTTINLHGNTILPGLVESHAHLQQLGEWEQDVNVKGDTTIEQMIAKVLERAKLTPKGEWIIGSGWDEGYWNQQLPNNIKLSELVPDHPVVLKGMRGFGTFGNKMAFELAHLSADIKSPPGGEIKKDANGIPTGILLNSATDLLHSMIPSKTVEQKKRILEYGVNQLIKAGYVSVHHAGVRGTWMQAYKELADESRLKMRVEAMVALTEDNKDVVAQYLKSGPYTHSTNFLFVKTAKAFYDGSLGSRGAKLIDPYSDDPHEHGEFGVDYGFQPEMVKQYMENGFQLAIHAIGDGGNRDVLDFIETIYKEFPESKNKRHRIEHAQIVHPDDFKRFNELNIVASMEPAHAIEDSPWAEERVGSDRIQGAYAWRTMRKNDVTLTFNSDLAGTDYNFFYGLFSAITRNNTSDPDNEGWYPEQCLTIEETIRAYTIWTAYTSSLEESTGSIEKGKWADLTIIKSDLLNTQKTDYMSIKDQEVEYTIVNGTIVYQNKH